MNPKIVFKIFDSAYYIMIEFSLQDKGLEENCKALQSLLFPIVLVQVLLSCLVFKLLLK